MAKIKAGDQKKGDIVKKSETMNFFWDFSFSRIRMRLSKKD